MRQARKRTTSEIICQNFKIPSETIFQDYKCTYRSSVLFFGRLYVGEEHFLFIANMFGLIKKCCISIDSITKIEEISDSTIAIGEKVDGQEIEYIFGSFKGNNAYQLMRALWKGQQIESDIFKAQNDMLQQGDSAMMLQQGHVEANFFNPQVVETEKQKMVEVQFPCSVDKFYDFFLADTATVYPRKKHLQGRGGSNIRVSQWRKNQQLNSQVREVTAMMKVNGIPFLKEAGMSQVWMLKRQEDSIKLNIVTQMADVPYAAYFNCQEHIMITKDGDKKCRMTIETAVIFNKSTYMKGTILSRTFGDLKEEYESWIKNVTAALEAIKKKKEQERKSSDVEYESSTPHSEKLIPEPKIETKKLQFKWNKFTNLTLEQKVDITFKMVIALICLNLLQLALRFF